MRGRVSTAILVIGLIGSLSSASALALFILDRFHMLPFSLFPGYEGSYMQFAGYSTDFPSKVFGKVGDPAPPGASQWTLTPNYVNIDVDEAENGVQNFIAAGLSYSGLIEKTPYGTVISDGPVKYTKTWTEGDKVITKTVEARVYYFTHKLYLTSKYDEKTFLGIGTTEKGCPIQNANLYMYTSVVNWEPRGNDTGDTGAWILAVEVAEVKYWRTDNTGSGARLSEGMPDGATASMGFAQGQTLALSNDLSTISPMSGMLGREYIAELQQNQPDRISADPRLRNYAYFSLPITELGAKGGNCYVSYIFATANNPLVDVTLRVHVLKVDSWIAVQTRGSEPKPPQPPGGTSDNPLEIIWRDLTYWFSSNFGVPLQIAGYVLILLILLFVAGVFFILLLAVAIRVGVSLRHRVTGYE